MEQAISTCLLFVNAKQTGITVCCKLNVIMLSNTLTHCFEQLMCITSLIIVVHSASTVCISAFPQLIAL